jgi:hypothetical protein
MGVIAVVVLIELWLLAVKQSKGLPISRDLLRTGLTALLMVALWRGNRWALWLSTILFGAAGAFSIFVAVAESIVLPLLILGVAYLVAAGSLLFVPAVEDFLKYQRERVKP